MSSDLESNADEIERARKVLAIGQESFRRLPTEEAERVYQTALRRFVSNGQPRWWWEHFSSSTSRHFGKGDGCSHLIRLVPDPDESVWFIAEDFTGPEFSVWEGSTRDIQAILGECYSFEYYLIQRQLRWLLCENHHNVMVAVGSEVEARLNGLKNF